MKVTKIKIQYNLQLIDERGIFQSINNKLIIYNINNNLLTSYHKYISYFQIANLKKFLTY